MWLAHNRNPNKYLLTTNTLYLNEGVFALPSLSSLIPQSIPTADLQKELKSQWNLEEWLGICKTEKDGEANPGKEVDGFSGSLVK